MGGCEGGSLHQYNFKMLLTSSNMQKVLSYFDLIPGMKYTKFCYFHNRGNPHLHWNSNSYRTKVWLVTQGLILGVYMVDGYLSLKSAGMCWLTLALDGHTGILQNFKNIKLTHEMVIRPTVVCEILYRWLKCSSLNPCLNLQRVKNILPLGLIVLVFLAWGHLHHTCDY